MYIKISRNINTTKYKFSALACSVVAKVAGLKPDEANNLFSIYLTVLVAPVPGVYLASNRN
jgi:hypothetical protein